MGRKSRSQLVSYAGTINGFMVPTPLIAQALRSSRHVRRLAPQFRGLFRPHFIETTPSILFLLRFCYHDRLAIAGNCRYAYFTSLDNPGAERTLECAS